VELQLQGIDSDADTPQDVVNLIVFADRSIVPDHVSVGLSRPDDDYDEARCVLLTREQAAQLRAGLDQGLAHLDG